MLGVGAVFWLEHRQEGGRRADWPQGEQAFSQKRMPPENGMRFAPPPGGAPLFSGFADGHQPGPPPERGRPPEPGLHVPLLPFFGVLFASFACAFLLAWYFAKPIRHLRSAFDAAAEGNLDVRIGRGMGGRRDELADLGRDFDRMTERLCSLMSAQKNLLHDVSHEMRSPLARLQAAIGLARQQPGRMEDSLERIERESERMNQLVGELLTLSRLDAGAIGIQESVDMAELLNTIVEDARFEGLPRQIQIDFVAGKMPEIRANAELLHRAIENVVRNALRHSPDGGAIRIEAGLHGELFRLAVIDHGPGVAEAEIEHIFQPFFRGELQVSGGGYGLGLTIAKRVISGLGGKIRAENGKTDGLIVEVLLSVL